MTGWSRTIINSGVVTGTNCLVMKDGVKLDQQQNHKLHQIKTEGLHLPSEAGNRSAPWLTERTFYSLQTVMQLCQPSVSCRAVYHTVHDVRDYENE